MGEVGAEDGRRGERAPVLECKVFIVELGQGWREARGRRDRGGGRAVVDEFAEQGELFAQLVEAGDAKRGAVLNEGKGGGDEAERGGVGDSVDVVGCDFDGGEGKVVQRTSLMAAKSPRPNPS